MRIRKVIDLHTGLPHPRRDARGRFISRRYAAQVVRVWDDTIRKHEQGAVLWFTWQRWVAVLTTMRIW